MTHPGAATPPPATWLGHRRIQLPTCDSTNDEAAAAAANGAAHGTVVVADAQRRGRGRHGRAWHSPPGENLYLSCVLRPDAPPRMAPPVTLAAGIAVADAVNALGAGASLVWPNDVYIGRRKLAGILTEMTSRAGHIEHLIVGIGINVATARFPGPLADTATSLALALNPSASPVDRAALLDDLLARLELWLDRFFTGGVTAIADAWMARADGSPIALQTENGPERGLPVGLAEDGALIVETAGRRRRIASGEIRRI